MHTARYFQEVVSIAQTIDMSAIERLASELASLRERDGGYTKQVGDCVVVVPTVDAARVTPHTEAFQAVVWRCLVSPPVLQQTATKW